MQEKYNVLATGETKDVFLMRNNILNKHRTHYFVQNIGKKSQIFRVVNIIFPSILDRTCEIIRKTKTTKKNVWSPTFFKSLIAKYTKLCCFYILFNYRLPSD